MAEGQALLPGATLMNGMYRIDRVLGQGGFGITYLATDVNLDKKVAIKEFFPKTFCKRDGATSRLLIGTDGNTELVDRLKAKFLKEARSIARLDHPNIIRIYAAFEQNDTAYYVMEYIDGSNLSELVRHTGPLSKNNAVGYISKIGDALEYLHRQHINHLDVKPGNIMVRKANNEPVLIDFGLAKQYNSDGMQTSTTPVGISHGFAPMEQYMSGGVSEFTPQTDVYSLAATLYYLLSGITPPEAPKLGEEELLFPDTVPVDLVAPIAKAMSLRRPDRHPSIKEFIREINGTKQTYETPVPPVSPYSNLRNAEETQFDAGKGSNETPAPKDSVKTNGIKEKSTTEVVIFTLLALFIFGCIIFFVAIIPGSSKWNAALAEELGKKYDTVEKAKQVTDEDVTSVVDLMVVAYNEMAEMSEEYKAAAGNEAKLKEIEKKFNDDHTYVEALKNAYENLVAAGKVRDDQRKQVDDAKKCAYEECGISSEYYNEMPVNIQY